MQITGNNNHKKFDEIYGFDPFEAIPMKGVLLGFFTAICLVIIMLTWYNNVAQREAKTIGSEHTNTWFVKNASAH